MMFAATLRGGLGGGTGGHVLQAWPWPGVGSPGPSKGSIELMKSASWPGGDPAQPKRASLLTLLPSGIRHRPPPGPRRASWPTSVRWPAWSRPRSNAAGLDLSDGTVPRVVVARRAATPAFPADHGRRGAAHPSGPGEHRRRSGPGPPGHGPPGGGQRGGRSRYRPLPLSRGDGHRTAPGDPQRRCAPRPRPPPRAAAPSACPLNRFTIGVVAGSLGARRPNIGTVESWPGAGPGRADRTVSTT